VHSDVHNWLHAAYTQARAHACTRTCAHDTHAHTLYTVCMLTLGLVRGLLVSLLDSPPPFWSASVWAWMVAQPVSNGYPLGSSRILSTAQGLARSDSIHYTHAHAGLGAVRLYTLYACSRRAWRGLTLYTIRMLTQGLTRSDEPKSHTPLIAGGSTSWRVINIACSLLSR
jgi:hypothetical protein